MTTFSHFLEICIGQSVKNIRCINSCLGLYMKYLRKFSLFLLPALFLSSLPVSAAETMPDLHAASAVLMDADSGRILYEKNASEQLPMASTTKIMTLLVTLENADLNSIVTVSSHAASMPEVKLHIREGERYMLNDLCYSLMLESHNDTAVAIAEHVAGSTEAFAAMMNQKARDLGCFHTYFITPNGLDASDEHGMHSTTAKDLARILRFCLDRDDFLRITQAASHSFSDTEHSRHFTVQNKNAFFRMMDGVLTGKTGFTNGAGYCYAGALEQNGMRLISVVLACGWPNNRTWKWADTKVLMSYGLTQYHPEYLGEDLQIARQLPVRNGQSDQVSLSAKIQKKEFLISDQDSFSMTLSLPEHLDAPVQKNQLVGTVCYSINDTLVELFPIFSAEAIPAIDFRWCLKQVTVCWLSLKDSASAELPLQPHFSSLPPDPAGSTEAPLWNGHQNF